MTYQLPNYIISANINNPIIDYQWDDQSVEESLTGYKYADEIIRRLEPVSLRGKIAISIAIYEWILGRFNQLTNDPIPYQIAEVAWCANINKYYATYIEYDRDDYLGPINGALWCGFSFLTPMLYVSENISNPTDPDEYRDIYPYDENQWKLGLAYLIPITIHILNAPSLFKNWLDACVIRLLNFYTMPPEGPFDNLFGHKNKKEWLGDYVARELFDLSYNYNPKDAITLLNKFLSRVDYKKNPLLTSIDEFKRLSKGEVKEPYHIIE
ncbi:hypothetical protein I2492_04015 [Budviciaceae bacterium CWB-B4]|uniref:Uncharacterized protein n=1 Tax=Limnobaculum xujianqingii TaxID=2738837 RepID=A0A9D7FWF5_9GAMM|nr:hypothetical protein [Limnobaculum xujianqingii]MBK5072181.1 hypothetical protein [Limnobaculum xujianqingii]MBK5175490.1 hypothetical protein [Limnobaculum xujianqingii]